MSSTSATAFTATTRRSSRTSHRKSAVVYGSPTQCVSSRTYPGKNWKTNRAGLERLLLAGRQLSSGANINYKLYLDDYPVRECVATLTSGGQTAVSQGSQRSIASPAPRHQHRSKTPLRLGGSRDLGLVVSTIVLWKHPLHEPCPRPATRRGQGAPGTRTSSFFSYWYMSTLTCPGTITSA